MKFQMLARLIATVGLLSVGLAGAANAEADTIRIAKQFGLGYPPLTVMEEEKLFEQQSRMPDNEARHKLVWEIDKKLQEDGARPVIQHDWGATCWRPEVKGLNLAVNTIYNHWRFEDVWIDR